MILPMRRAHAGRHDGVAAGRIYLRGAASGDHSNIGMAADDRDTANAGGVDWKHVPRVLQQVEEG